VVEDLDMEAAGVLSPDIGGLVPLLTNKGGSLGVPPITPPPAAAVVLRISLTVALAVVAASVDVAWSTDVLMGRMAGPPILLLLVVVVVVLADITATLGSLIYRPPMRGPL
jgi:hypothetical protein